MTGTRRNADDRGYTLVEMLVTIIMLTLVVGSITAVVITSLKKQTSLADRGSALASARNAIEEVDRDIRSANPLCYVSPTEISMLETTAASGVTGSANGSVIVDYKVVGGTTLKYAEYATSSTAPSQNPLNPPSPGITCTATTPNATTVSTSTLYPTTLIATRTIIGNLVGTSSSAVFLNAGTTGSYDTCPVSGTGAGTALTAAFNPTNIEAITVNLSIEPSTLSAPVSASDCGTYLYNYTDPL